MKNNKNEKYGFLTEKEMKSVKGGHTFITTDIIPRCPACGEWVEINTYTCYIRCLHCGGSITIEEKNEE